MKIVLYHLAVFFSRMAELFSSHKSLHTARWAFLHELAEIAIPKEFISKKMSGLFLAVGNFERILCVLPTKKQKELTNVIILRINTLVAKSV
jgi:hypothetical protein